MISTEPTFRDVSDTALWAAIYRARETERPNALFRDPFARRLAGQRGEDIAVLAAKSVRGVVLGVVVTALIQAALSGIGLFVTGVPAGIPIDVSLLDEDLARRLRALRFHGLEKSAWNRYAEGGSPQVEVVLPGFKYNFMDRQAALGIHHRNGRLGAGGARRRTPAARRS